MLNDESKLWNFTKNITFVFSCKPIDKWFRMKRDVIEPFVNSRRIKSSL